MDWIYGLIGSGLITGAAYRKGSLSGSGALAAVIVGTILYALGSPVWFGLMIGFFISATFLTKWKQHRKKSAESVYQKTGRRDAGQVMANGGIGALLCIIHFIWPAAAWPLLMYIGVIATVTADTWATEVGGLSRSLPRSILTWRQVPKGTSGGVSGLGWFASAIGAGFIGLLAVWLARWDGGYNRVFQEMGGASGWSVALAAMLSGWLGANADSVLGATVQALFRCEVCGRIVESSTHCGKPTVSWRGWRSMDNDAVNLVSSLAGGVLVLVLCRVMLGN